MLRIGKFTLISLIVICLGAIYISLPNLFSEDDLKKYNFLPQRQLNLGLDLRGGAHLLLEVDFARVLADQRDSNRETIRQEFRRARLPITGLTNTDQEIIFTLVNAADAEKAKELLLTLFPTMAVNSLPDNKFTIAPSPTGINDMLRQTVAQSIEIIRRRVDETGTREPTIVQNGANRILVQLPGVTDPSRMKNLLGTTAKLSFHLVDRMTENPLEPLTLGQKRLPDDELKTSDGRPIFYVLDSRAIITGDQLVNAQASFQDAQPVVAFAFDTVGARRFGETTRDNVGRQFAIVLDNKVISAPVIREAIMGGSGIISGNFTTASANDLALLLRAGALPAPLKVIEERTVGPDLGQDSINAGMMASVVAVAAVLIFMMLAYGLFGLYACLALVVNLILIIACLTLFQATVTLPGIAAIVLTIGMAVDANVLIFERMREEAARGRDIISTIDNGYRESFRTILDSNLTTLIAALFLFMFGSGPIRGFAVTLAIGIGTSMFSAIMVTRVLVIYWLRRSKAKVLPI